MYDINDKANAIHNVQRFLYFLSKSGHDIPVVYPDGIFGRETRNAVRVFQTGQGIEQSGTVDFETFTRLVEVYRVAVRAVAPPASVRLFPRLLSGSQILPGEEHVLVSIIQGMLLSLGSVYDELIELEITGIYDEPTEKAVNKIKQAAGMNPDSVIDKGTFAVIAGLYESFVNDVI